MNDIGIRPVLGSPADNDKKQQQKMGATFPAYGSKRLPLQF